MFRPAIVTGYIPIQGHPRAAKDYGELGEQIFKPLSALHQVIPFYERLEDTWLDKLVVAQDKLPVSHSSGDNPQKNTLAYHCVQHQKFAWLLKAMLKEKSADPLVWIDYGIGHVPGVDWRVINAMFLKIQPNDFAIPGCWPAAGLMVNDFFPCWRFCGGLMVVPRHHVYPLYKRIKDEVTEHIKQTRNISWEVNSLARAEPKLPSLRWYLADHNQSMFTNYGASACAVSSPASEGQSGATSTLQ